MATLTLGQLVQHVQELPALPDTALKVLKLTDDPAASTRDIAQSISADLALTSRVLRIANSAYYGMPRSISTVNEAVLILGMQALRNLALAAAAYDTMKREFPGYRMAAGELWRHSIACAISSQIIARQTRAIRQEEAFVAGLLHDVGKVVLNIHVAPQFQTILALAELDSMPFHQAEKFVLGFDHAEVGAQVAEKWNLPPALCRAIAGHHCLNPDTEAAVLAAVVHVANRLAQTDSVGQPQGLFASPVDPRAIEYLKLSDADQEGVREETRRQMERARTMFE